MKHKFYLLLVLLVGACSCETGYCCRTLVDTIMICASYNDLSSYLGCINYAIFERNSGL